MKPIKGKTYNIEYRSAFYDGYVGLAICTNDFPDEDGYYEFKLVRTGETHRSFAYDEIKSEVVIPVVYETYNGKLEMDLKDAYYYLIGYQEWRRGEDERTMKEAGIDPKTIGVAIDTVLEFLSMREEIDGSNVGY